MYLHCEKYLSGYEHNKDNEDYLQYSKLVKELGADKLIQMDSKSATVSFICMYWRKANQIHNWFVNNTQEGIDNCQTSYVPVEDLIELLDVCNQVLADKELAEELLPTQAGFFFGTTEYDEYYFNDVLETKEALERIIANSEGWSFTYSASW